MEALARKEATMVQVHTIHDGGRWRNRVDGLQQGTAYDDRSCAVAAGRLIVSELGGTFYGHDVDGHVVESWASSARPRRETVAARYSA